MPIALLCNSSVMGVFESDPEVGQTQPWCPRFVSKRDVEMQTCTNALMQRCSDADVHRRFVLQVPSAVVASSTLRSRLGEKGRKFEVRSVEKHQVCLYLIDANWY